MAISLPGKTSIDTLRALPVCKLGIIMEETTSTDENVATPALMRPLNIMEATSPIMPRRPIMIALVPEDRGKKERDPGADLRRTVARNMDIMKLRRLSAPRSLVELSLDVSSLRTIYTADHDANGTRGRARTWP